MSDDRAVSRRDFVRAAAVALAAVATTGRVARAARRAGPGDDIPEDVKKVLRARFGDRPVRAGHVSLDVPEVAPDGREVPVFIQSDLPMTPDQYVKGIHIIVDHNPDIHVAGFEFTPAMGEASIDTRIKMRRSSTMRAIVETSTGELWSTNKLVYVTMNGCV